MEQGKDKSSQNLFQDMKIIVDGLSYLNSDFFFILLGVKHPRGYKLKYNYNSPEDIVICQ